MSSLFHEPQEPDARQWARQWARQKNRIVLPRDKIAKNRVQKTARAIKDAQRTGESAAQQDYKRVNILDFNFEI